MNHYAVVFKAKNESTVNRCLESLDTLQERDIKRFYHKLCAKENLKLAGYERVAMPMSEDLTDSYDTYSEFYEKRARRYAEYYGIINYKVRGNIMIFNQNYGQKEVASGTWVGKPVTYRREVELYTYNVRSTKLDRLQRNGWDNV